MSVTVADIVLPDGSLRKGWRWTDDGGAMVLSAPGRIQAALIEPDIILEQGATTVIPVRWYDESAVMVDLSSGYTASLKIKLTRTSSALVSLANGSGITLAASESSANLIATFSATATGALTFTRAFIECAVTHSGGVVTRLFEGAVQLRKRVTG